MGEKGVMGGTGLHKVMHSSGAQRLHSDAQRLHSAQRLHNGAQGLHKAVAQGLHSDAQRVAQWCTMGCTVMHKGLQSGAQGDAH